MRPMCFAQASVYSAVEWKSALFLFFHRAGDETQTGNAKDVSRVVVINPSVKK